jgi:lysozyme
VFAVEVTRTRATLIAALALVAAAGLPAPSAAPGARAKPKVIRGIDVSRFQGHVAWRQVAKTKNRFAFIQASRGSGDDCRVIPEECGADPTYERNYRNARSVGLRVGPYHRAFASGRTPDQAREDAREEAKLFIATVGRLRGRDLLPVLDVETPLGRLDEKELRIWIATWTRKVHRRLGYRPIIYTNYTSWQATGDALRFAKDGHRLWVANFDVPRPAVPASNWAGKGWSVWQYTSTGRVRGIAGHVDRNRLFKGFRKVSVEGYRD